jgi:FkbM family methyltransferase
MKGAARARRIIARRANAVGQLWRKLPSRVLLIAARALTSTPRLEPEPSWTFNGNWNRPGRRAAGRRALLAELRDRDEDAVFTIRWYEGLRFAAHLDNDVGASLFLGGSYEPNEFALWNAVLGPEMVVIDAGAHEGLFTLFAARKVGRFGQVLAIEPSPRETIRLRANLSVNGMDWIVIHPVALGDNVTTATLHVAEAAHSGHNSLGGAIANTEVTTVGSIDVPVRSLDHIVDEANLLRLDVVKLDVEGYELRALHGARRTLERFRPLLQLEVNAGALQSQSASPDALLSALRAVSYDVWTFDRSEVRLLRHHAGEPMTENVIAGPKDWSPPPPWADDPERQSDVAAPVRR